MNLYDLLNNNLENNILPFFWQHHEDEETLRKYMQINFMQTFMIFILPPIRKILQSAIWY